MIDIHNLAIVAGCGAAGALVTRRAMYVIGLFRQKRKARKRVS